MNYLELFSGIGGFRKAAEYLSKDTDIDFKCVGFSEIDQFALTSYNANFRLNGEIRMHNITDFTSKNSNVKSLDNFELLLGGFPCQAFSVLGKQLGLEDERGRILFSIHKLLEIKKPSIIVLENVRNIVRHDQGNTLNKILNFFTENGYCYTNTVILDTQKFGLPQRRSRIFFVCSRKNINIELTEQAIVDNFNRIRKHSLLVFKNVLDILENKVDKKYYLSTKVKHTILADGSKNFWSKSQIDLEIARTLTATMVKWHRACQDNYYSNDFILKGISNKNASKSSLMKKAIRRLTPLEAFKLQGFDQKFHNNAVKAGVSNYQLYKQAGNALSVNTGYALLHYLFVNCRIQDQ